MWPHEANGTASRASNGASCAAVLALTVLFNAGAGSAVPELPGVPSGHRTRGQCDDAWSTPSKSIIAGSVPSLDQTPSHHPDGGWLGRVHRTPYSFFCGTLLAIAGAAPVALAVWTFHGTASSSPKTMGRVLVHLAMLSTASGWKLPPGSEAPEMTITGEAHDSPITGEVDGARDRRRLVASSCNAAWCVRPPRPCSPPLRKLAAAFLSAAQRTIQTAITMTVVDAIAIVDAILVFLYAIVLGFAVVATTLVIAIPATTATIVPFTQQDIPLATAAVP